LLLLVLPAQALADVVGPCPPLFDPSHRGCHFQPSRTELFVVGGVLLFAVAAAIALLAWANAKERKGPRDS
jgi:hypothetical protein